MGVFDLGVSAPRDGARGRGTRRLCGRSRRKSKGTTGSYGATGTFRTLVRTLGDVPNPRGDPRVQTTGDLQGEEFGASVDDGSRTVRSPCRCREDLCAPVGRFSGGSRSAVTTAGETRRGSRLDNVPCCGGPRFTFSLHPSCKSIVGVEASGQSVSESSVGSVPPPVPGGPHRARRVRVFPVSFKARRGSHSLSWSAGGEDRGSRKDTAGPGPGPGPFGVAGSAVPPPAEVLGSTP